MLWLGAACGFGFAIAVAFAIVSFLDHRYVTRLEYRATLEAIRAELDRIGKYVRTNGGEGVD